MKIRFYISLFILVFISGNLLAQKSTGDKHYNKLEYADAIKHYKKDYEKKGDLESLSKLADCYYKTHQYALALDFYKEKEKTGLNSYQLFSLAQLYYENDQPEEGKEYLRKYATASGSNWWMEYVDGVKVLKEEQSNYLISNLKFLNTEYSEFSPQFSEGEMIFTSDRPASRISSQTYGGTGTPFLNIFKTENFSLKDSNYHANLFFEKPDVSSHAGPAYWDNTNSVLYYTFVNDIEKGKVNRASIMFASKEGKKWKKGETFPFTTEASIGHPAIYNEEITIVSSDVSIGKGGKDLFLFYRTAGENRMIPVPGVNTPGDEVFPSLRKMKDGSYILYFSSNGFPGKGGLDFFSMKFDPTNFSDTTITWHKELSSSHDDFGITFEDDSRGFFSSDRSGGNGGDDIYHFIENPNAVALCITCLKDGSTCAGQAVSVKKDNEILQTVYTDENGCVFLHKLPDGANALQLMNNTGDDIKIKSLTSGEDNKGKLVVLDRDGMTLYEIFNQDGKLITQEVRTVWLTDLSGGPAKGIRIEVKSHNGEVVETIITDSEGKAVLKKIPPGDRFILSIDADEVYLNPALKNDKTTGIILLDQFGKRVDSLGVHHKDIRISVLKIKTLDLCLYNQITGEPLAHYTVTLRASDGTPIDTAITDKDGCYKFKKLQQGEMLLVIENYEGGAIKSRINGLEETDVTAVVIKNSKGMIIESYSKNGIHKTKTFCVYDKNSKNPVKEMLIHLADEKYIIRDSVITGSDGCFTYHKLNDDDRYLTLIMAADEAEFFLKGKESSAEMKTEYVALSSDGILLDSIASSGTDYAVGILQKLILTGCLVSKNDGKPLAFTKVYFKDEKGNKTDSVITDKNGCFEYKKLGNSPAQMQVMNNGDMPFEFKMNEKSSMAKRMTLRDQYDNLVGNIDPQMNFNANGTKNSMICFYDQNSDSPVSGMNVTMKSGETVSCLLTNSQGCITPSFLPLQKYELSIPSEKVSVNTKSTNGGYSINIKADKNSINGNYNPGSEVIVHVSGIEFVTATFKTPDGNPVEDLPVEWYDSRSGMWSTSLTENNGNSKHVYNKDENEIKVRVKDSDEKYSFSVQSESLSGNVKLLDEKGNPIFITQLNQNKSFSVTVRSSGSDKGEMDLKGTIVSNGNPVNGATIYVKTSQGMLIQRTASDKEGNYYFKKLPSSSMMLEVDTSDLRMKFKTHVELNGTVTSNSSNKKLAGREVILGDGTGLKLELQNTDENGNFTFKVDLDKIHSAINDSEQNPWNNIMSGVNAEIVLNTIYFDYDKWNITFESERELDKVVKFLNAQPSASLNIKAHTDSRGNDSYNMTLSRKRARSVMKYFKNHNIDTMRLMPFGFGESQLINKCDNNSSCSDALHKKNRRIEFEISWNGTAHNTRTASPLISSNDTDEMHRVSENTNTTNTTSPSESGRWYKVQISTSGKLIPCTKDNFKGIENVEYYIDNGIYKYTVGKFATKEEAMEYRKKLIELFPQAFPVILENGIRVK